MDEAFFKKSGDWDADSLLIERCPNSTFYVSGYCQAIEIIGERIRNDKSYRQTLIYPLAFLCRHLVELHLKRLISLQDEPCGRTHSLAKLWSRVKAAYDNHMSKDDILRADRIIDEIEAVDPHPGTAFRYSEAAPYIQDRRLGDLRVVVSPLRLQEDVIWLHQLLGVVRCNSQKKRTS